MSNITKNLLLALTAVCAIALIVFCIQLIVLNRGVEPRNPGLTISGGPQQGDEAADPDSEAEGEDTSGGENGEGDFGLPLDIPNLPPEGERHEIRVMGDTRLIIYAKEESFDFVENDLNWRFEYTGAGEAALEIRFLFVSSQGIDADAEMFLNNYAEGVTSEFGGEASIQGSALRGYYVSAHRGGITYEAWVHTLPDSDMALVFVINYQNEQQSSALYEILRSLDLA